MLHRHVHQSEVKLCVRGLDFHSHAFVTWSLVYITVAIMYHVIIRSYCMSRVTKQLFQNQISISHCSYHIWEDEEARCQTEDLAKWLDHAFEQRKSALK